MALRCQSISGVLSGNVPAANGVDAIRLRLRRAVLAGVVAATVLLAVCFRLAPRARSGELVSSLAPLPGESRTAASDYERCAF